MITIPRALCRDVLAVVRKLGRGRALAGLSIELIAGRDGLTIQAATPDVAVRHRTPGRRPECRLVVPLETLAEFAGRCDDPVRVHVDQAPTGRNRRGLQRPFPALPGRLTPGPPGLLAALEAASAVTAKDDSSRFVLNRIQLRGGQGAIVASDCKQLLLQTGFRFPWTGDVLIPRSEVFSLLAAQAGSVSLARTAIHVAIVAGPWTVALAIDTKSKFPDVDSLIARIKRPAGELVLDPDDRARLLRDLNWLGRR